MKKVCYTVIVGDYDDLWVPIFRTTGWEYICYTNQNIKSDFWRVIKIQGFKRDYKKISRLHKIIPPSADLSLYVDANIKICCDLDQFVFKYLENDFMVLTHPQRYNIEEEVSACIYLGKDTREVLEKQINQYLREGYIPDKLYACGIIVRRHTREILDFSRKWFDEIEKHSHRDQVSLPYVSWKNPLIKIDTAPFGVLKDKFEKHKHKHLK